MRLAQNGATPKSGRTLAKNSKSSIQSEKDSRQTPKDAVPDVHVSVVSVVAADLNRRFDHPIPLEEFDEARIENSRATTWPPGKDVTLDSLSHNSMP